MKIGILTVNGLNSGSFLQAFALKKLVTELEHKPYVINTLRPKQFVFRIGLKNTSFGLKKAFTLLSAWKNLGQSSSHIHYNALIIGSDVVWGDTKGRLADMFFGLQMSADKKIAYAPCCAKTTYDDLSQQQIDGIRNIDFLSARDKKTAELIERITDKKPPIVLDPTFLIDWSQYEIPNGYRDYILVYSYLKRNKEMIIKTKELSQKTGKKIISLPYYKPWCDICLPVSPFKFLGIMRKADYVVTNTFHGTAFSLIYKKPFISFPSASKTADLLDSLGIKKKKLFFNHKKISGILQQKKEKSFDFLKKTLC